MSKNKILGVKFDNVTLKEAQEMCEGFLINGKVNMIVTPNPEIVMAARKDEEFMQLINFAELVVPDGIGIIIGGKILKRKFKERVPGFDLICKFFETKGQEKRVYLLGAKPGVAEQAKIKLEEKYNLKVVGVQDGYYKKENENEIIKSINDSNANILLVGTGMKKQEQFIYNNKESFSNVRVAVGCGGSIDVFAGVAKRAPKIFIKLGLEWFYRLLKQPSRIGRMMQLPKFLIEVIIKGKKEI